MLNEFEKQVQQKMEELKLSPSAPVWEKVEKQIRQRRERRRLIFWLPLLALLLGGGIWFAMKAGDHTSTVTGKNETKLEKANHSSIEKSETVPSNKNSIKEDNNPGENNSLNSSLNQATSSRNTTRISNTNSPLASNNYRVDKKGNTAVKIKSGNSISSKENEKLPSKRNEELKEKISSSSDKVEIEEQPKQLTETTTVEKKPEQKIESKPSEKVNDALPKKEEPVKKEESKKTDSVSSKPSSPKKAADAKWKFAVAFAPGVSGADNGLRLFAQDKALAAAPQNSPGTFYSYSSTDNSVKKGLFFSAGMDAVRKLNERFSFVTGLHYNYYSYSMTVGRRKDSSVLLGVSNTFYSAIDSVQNSYKNHFHILSIPIAINWKLSKKMPLHLEAGLGLQRILQTNALVLDANGSNYIRDNSEIRKTQIYSQFGLNYAIALKKNTLAIGPQVQYGLSKLDKTDSGRHLFSFGLKAQLSLKKNL